MDPALVLAPVVAFAISACTSMVGVSGALLLLPFQLSVLGLAGPSASATNMVYNLVATPGAIWRYAADRRMDWRLAADISVGSLPGLLAGWWIRSHWLLDPARFKAFVGIVLLTLGVRLLVHQWRRRFRPARSNVSLTEPRPRGAVFATALVVGIVGGVYGIGGGAFMAPILVAVFHRSLHLVAGALLLSTFANSIAGVAMYTVLPAPLGVSTGPDWVLGLLFGAGGTAGSYVGARWQSRVRAAPLEIALAGGITLLGAIYAFQSLPHYF